MAEFPYIKRYRPDYAICIQYSGYKTYYLSRICENNSGIAYNLKAYKTLRGAVNGLMRVDGGYENRGIEPTIEYGTEEFINNGCYWKRER